MRLHPYHQQPISALDGHRVRDGRLSGRGAARALHAADLCAVVGALLDEEESDAHHQAEAAEEARGGDAIGARHRLGGSDGGGAVERIVKAVGGSILGGHAR